MLFFNLSHTNRRSTRSWLLIALWPVVVVSQVLMGNVVLTRLSSKNAFVETLNKAWYHKINVVVDYFLAAWKNNQDFTDLKVKMEGKRSAVNRHASVEPERVTARHVTVLLPVSSSTERKTEQKVKKTWIWDAECHGFYETDQMKTFVGFVRLFWYA